MNLFLDKPTKKLVKVAEAMTRLSENPDDWQAEIIDEFYKRVPFAGVYEAKLIVRDLDPERRYALAAIMLTTKENPVEKIENIDESLKAKKSVFVPVLVKEGKMFPLDIFVSDGVSQPLTEKRLKKEMFRPHIFDAIGKDPGTQDMLETLFPPHRQGMSGGLNSYTGPAKLSSAGIFDKIVHTIKKEEVDRVKQAFASDPELVNSYYTNQSTHPFLTVLSAYQEPVSGKSLIKTASHHIKPTVIQVSSTKTGFLIKTANPDALLPEEHEVSRPEAEKIVGADVVKSVERDGTVTISTDKAQKQSLADLKVGLASEFGEYKVRTADGRELVGWVFPKVVDLDGTILDISIFSNGSESAMQEKVSGVLVGKGSDLIDERPEGFGCFYLSRQGSVLAFVPVTVTSEVESEGGKGYLCETILGQRAVLRAVPGLNRIAKMDERNYGIPEDCGWIPMRSLISLASTAEDYLLPDKVKNELNDVKISSLSYDRYAMKGLPLVKLASLCPIENISKDQVVFNLAIMGVDPKTAIEKVAAANKGVDWVSVGRVRKIKLASDIFNEVKKTAAAYLRKLPRMPVLLKEAAMLADPDSIDSVLSLGFINSENVMTFLEYIPELEQSLSKLCNLLLSSRVGLGLDTSALERMIKHMDTVLTGLRELKQAEI